METFIRDIGPRWHDSIITCDVNFSFHRIPFRWQMTVTSLSCSRNQSEIIQALWHGTLSSWKQASDERYTVVIKWILQYLPLRCNEVEIFTICSAVQDWGDKQCTDRKQLWFNVFTFRLLSILVAFTSCKTEGLMLWLLTDHNRMWILFI